MQCRSRARRMWATWRCCGRPGTGPFWRSWRRFPAACMTTRWTRSAAPLPRLGAAATTPPCRGWNEAPPGERSDANLRRLPYSRAAGPMSGTSLAFGGHARVAVGRHSSPLLSRYLSGWHALACRPIFKLWKWPSDGRLNAQDHPENGPGAPGRPPTVQPFPAVIRGAAVRSAPRAPAGARMSNPSGGLSRVSNISGPARLPRPATRTAPPPPASQASRPAAGAGLESSQSRLRRTRHDPQQRSGCWVHAHPALLPVAQRCHRNRQRSRELDLRHAELLAHLGRGRIEGEWAELRVWVL